MVILKYLMQMLIIDGLFTGMLLLAVKDGAIGAVHLYPQEVQQRVIELGLTTEEKINKRKKLIQLSGVALYLAMVLFIVFVWNGARDFFTVTWQVYLLLEGMNLYDCFIIDMLWVKRSKFWIIPGTEDLAKNYITIREQVKKRIIVSIMFLIIAFLVAGIANLLY